MLMRATTSLLLLGLLTALGEYFPAGQPPGSMASAGASNDPVEGGKTATATKKKVKARKPKPVGSDVGNLEDAHPLVARLNERFRLGKPSNDLHAAGVLVHVNDRTEDPAHRWKPCYQACNHGQFADRVSCSLINAGQPRLWPGGGGLVLSPQHAKVRCSYGCDGATNSKRKPGGCLPVVCDGPPSNCQSCAFASDDLGAMLKYHRATTAGGLHNEVVVDSAVWPEGIVEAVFETTDYDEHARAAHADYLVQHGVSAATFPLLKLDLALSTQGKPPFSLAVQSKEEL